MLELVSRKVQQRLIDGYAGKTTMIIRRYMIVLSLSQCLLIARYFCSAVI